MNTELMLRVKERVLARPDLVDMELWASGTKKRLGLFPCGTICCVAGHAIELSGGSALKCQKLENTECKFGRVAYIGGTASRYLGISVGEGSLLFHFNKKAFGPKHPYHDLYLQLIPLLPGTKPYAEVVAKAVDRCIARNAALEVTSKDTEFAEAVGVQL